MIGYCLEGGLPQEPSGRALSFAGLLCGEALAPGHLAQLVQDNWGKPSQNISEYLL